MPRPAISATRLPVLVEPVKATRRTFGCATNASPNSEPGPVRMFNVPAGRPACVKNSATFNDVSGVVGEGFATTVLPVTSAGPIFVPSSVMGKFHGTIAAHTPIGWRSTKPYIEVSGRFTYEPRTVGAN